MSQGPVLVEHAFPVDYVPRAGRIVRRAWLAGSAPVTLPELASPPVAIEMRRVLHGHYVNPNAKLRDETYYAIAGGLSRRVLDAEGAPMGAEALSGVDLRKPAGPWLTHGYPFPAVPADEALSVDVEALRPKRVEADGRAAAAAEVARVAGRMGIVDGVLAAPGAEPIWAVRHAHDSGVIQISAVLAGETDAGVVHAWFRADHLDRAVEVAEDLVRTENRRRGRDDFHVVVVGSIAVHDASLLAFDEVAANSEKVVRWALRHPGSEGFAKLPVAALRAWADFREAAESIAADRPEATLDAMRALGRVKLALPASTDDLRTGGVTASDMLHRILGGVPEMVAHWDADLRARANDEDVAFLAVAGR
jgi:hypothetical protein